MTPIKVGDVMGDSKILPFFLQTTATGVAGAAGTFSASRELAELCDQILPELNFKAQVARGDKVTDLVHSLPPSLSQQLHSRFGNGILTELVSLEKETDSELYFSGLLHLAGRLAEHEGMALTAVGLYHRVEVASGIRELAGLANQRRLALQGDGNFGSNAEVFLRSMSREMGDWRNLAGAFAGATVASGLYKYTFYRLARTGAAGLAARGIGPATFEASMMRIRSKTIGFVTGSVGASLAERGLRASLGQRVAWDPALVSRDAVAASINLFAWRLASSFSNSYTLRALSAEPQPRNFIWKELEIFAWRQGMSAAGLGVAMLANQKLFDTKPESRLAGFSQLASTLAGMNVGGLGANRALGLIH